MALSQRKSRTTSLFQKSLSAYQVKKCSAFGEPKSKWRQAFHAPHKSDQVEICILNECPSIVVRESRQSVIEYARELIDMAYPHGWIDQLEEWGVWQKEVI